MRFRTRMAIALGGLAIAVGSVVVSVPANANTDGTDLYTPGEGEGVTYARTIRLAHSGSANGRLLATFERGVAAGEQGALLIRESTDDGKTWSTVSEVADGMTGPGHPAVTFYQPFLYELPKQVGEYPAGTLLLAANVIGLDNSTNFQLWRSGDQGRTWDFVSMFQYAENADQNGEDDPGIWEPFLTLDGDGNLLCFFADERQRDSHSQFVGHIVSPDGGDTWSANPDGSTNFEPGLVKDVATATQTERPGMPTVTTLPDGTYVLAYEICASARGACEAYIKKSTDGGHTWGTGPADPGQFVETTDGRYLGSSPYITWSPGGGPNGQLMMAGMRVRRTADNSFVPEDHEAVFVNTNNGDGAWSWLPAPLKIAFGGDGSLSNYSPSLLPSVDGSEIRYTAPSNLPGGRSERTESANAGVLPYTAPWDESQAGWKLYGGEWALLDGVFSETTGGTGGNKALAGSTGWTDYVVEGDVRLDSAGTDANAGFLVRVSDPDVGTDAHNGYYVGLGQGLQLGRQQHNWTELTSAEVPGGVQVGSWYHVRIEVSGCQFAITAEPANGSGEPVELTYDDAGCTVTSGAVGVRDFGGTASWRDLTVKAL